MSLDQSKEAHDFCAKNILINCNSLIQELIRINERNWDLDNMPWFQDLFLVTEHESYSEESDFEDLEIVTREPYEFYIVTDWFADRLQERDELVTRHFDFPIWGRETTGQHIVLDWVFQEIWKEFKESL